MKKNSNLKRNENVTEYDSDSNEIKIIRRTLEKYTHEVIEDSKIKRVTSWRKSDAKFKKNLIFNILSCGILHIISLFYPNIYIKLYCIPWSAKECDFFLVENIYGILTLCKRIYKKNKNNNEIDYKIIKENGHPLNDDNIKSEYNKMIRNVTYSFEYKSCLYEYDEKNNEISPIYMNLSKMKNKDIFNYFSDGLSSHRLVNAFRERFGKNEYKLDLKLIYLYFFKNQISSLIIVILIAIIECISYRNYLIMLLKIILAILIIVIQIIVTKIFFINKYNNEFTLDGKSNNVHVKRNYLLKDENQLYHNINNEELLPGDIIFLKNNEYVPCDCIIMDGECLVSESNLTGSLNVYKKIALKNNSEFFDYKYSNINLLYHGMKIVKSFSKSDKELISALCINIGPNTFKANLFSNSLYFLERKKEYNNVYNLFGERKTIFIYMSINICISIIAAILFFSIFLSKKYAKSDFFKENIPKIALALFCKSLMAVYFIIQNILIFLSIINLKKLDLVCFDKSRLIKSGKINTIIFNKTETLSENSLEIYGYHPVSYNINRNYQIICKNILKSQSKNLNKYLFDYYQNYLNNSKNSKNENNFQFNLNIEHKSELSIVLFLECILCCNSIEKYDMDCFGNDLEIEILNDMKWDIKQNEENNNNNYLKLKFPKDTSSFKENKNQSISNFNYQYYYITSKIVDMFPKNYYKLAESSNLGILENSTKNIEFKKNRQNKQLIRTNTIRTATSNTSFYLNQIQLDIENSNNNSYKLRIYKKFIINGTLNSASIVYNFLTKELRFMVKGTPEEIINKCHEYTLPPDLEKIISIYRKRGLILLVYATKKLNLEEYDDNDELENYMEDLTFVGFITLENKIKDYVKPSIKELKKFNDNFLIISGDNAYNCLSTGFQSGIIENKNIFILDKEENNKITIRKIYSSKVFHENINKKEDKTSKISGNINFSRRITKNNQIKSAENNEIINKNKSNLRKNPLKEQNNFNEPIKNDDLFLPELDNIPDITKNNDKGRKNLKEIVGRNKNRELINTNSEQERIINKEKTISTNTEEKMIINIPQHTKKKVKILTNIPNNKSINDEHKIKEEEEAKNLIFMEKYFYHNIFKEYDDVKESIFCMSGKLVI